MVGWSIARFPNGSCGGSLLLGGIHVLAGGEAVDGVWWCAGSAVMCFDVGRGHIGNGGGFGGVWCKSRAVVGWSIAGWMGAQPDLVSDSTGDQLEHTLNRKQPEVKNIANNSRLEHQSWWDMNLQFLTHQVDSKKNVYAYRDKQHVENRYSMLYAYNIQLWCICSESIFS